MLSNQRSPLWPYLLVLAGLFLLSLAVPRGWQAGRGPQRSEDRLPPTGQRAVTPPKQAPTPVAVVRPNSESAATPLATPVATESLFAEPRISADQRVPVRTTTVEPSVHGPLAEAVAEKIAGTRRFGPPKILRPQNDTRRDRETAPSAQLPGENNDASSYWPTPRSLLAELDRLSQHVECLSWAARVEELCVELCRTAPGETQSAAQILRQLRELAARGSTLADELHNPRAAAELRRVQYSLQRRLLVWEATISADRRAAVYANISASQEQLRQLRESLAGADAQLRSLPYGEAWRKYLLLDELRRLADAHPPLAEDDARQLARHVLARISPRQPTAAQRRVLDDRAVQTLADQLRHWAAEPIDAREVLVSVEQYEASGLASDARRVVASQRRLVWSPAEADRQLAQDLDLHYRNANVRMTLTAELFNRLTPVQPVSAGIVRDTVLGTPVSGYAETTTHLAVKLIPDPRRLHVWLEAQGSIDSDTRSASGPAVFSNRGASNYLVRKAVVIDGQGLGVANSSAEANSDTRLTGVHTDFDGIPLLGPLARNYAESQHEALRDDAQWEIQQKVATQAGQRVNAEVDRRLSEAEQKVRRQVLEPLAKLELDPQPLALLTTTERVTMRLRLAGQNQLGGHTARPQAPSDSLASAQVHESALNNTLDQLQLAGRTFALPDLFRHLAERTSRPKQPLPDDLPDHVQITFAATDPVRVRCQDGTVRLTLAVDELRQGSRRWHDFLISTTYESELDGRHARLVRQGAIELGGDTYKGQPEVVLRGIFSKVLSRERKLELVPPLVTEHPRLADLCVTQCVIDDGWIGLALGPDRTIVRSDVARRPATSK